MIVSSGFAEIGNEALQKEVKRIGKESGLRLLGPNCMGLYNPYHGLDTFFLPRDRVKRPKKGNVAIVTQSGAILHCLLGMMSASNIGVSAAVTYGNAVDIDESELYEYLAGDGKTEVVVSYIESVGDGRRFIEKARLLNAKKALIVLKSGKGAKGEAAAFSHTGRLAGRYEVFASILKQFGIKEAEDFDSLTDTVKALSYQRPSTGNRILIITNGGGSGVLAADECTRQGLVVGDPSPGKLERLKKKLPHFYGFGNPFDVTAQVRDEDYGVVLEGLKDDYDGFVIIGLAGVVGLTPGLADILKDFKDKTGKPVVFHTFPTSEAMRLIRRIEKSAIPVYHSPERAVKGLRALLYEGA